MGNFSELIKSNPRLKSIAHFLLFAKNEYRPRWWARVASRFIFKRGKGSKIRWSSRMDVLPSNKFYLGKASIIEDYTCVNNLVGDVIIGDRSLIGIFCAVTGPVNLGNDVLLAQNVTLSGLNHGYEDVNETAAAIKL